MNWNSPRSRRWAILSRLLDSLDTYVTERAHRHTRTVLPAVEMARLPGTRTIEYRLPVWNLRERCDACAGSGLDGARPCPPCDGTGVRTYVEDPARGGGPGAA